MEDIVECVDYIFNRYAYLGLEQDASEQDIKTEIRKRRAENHPDKLLRVSQDIKNLAAKQLEYIEQCERVLLNPEVKPFYDQKLKDFIEKEPHLVSTQGHAIVDPTRFKVKLHYLLNQEIEDFGHLEKQAANFTGYKEKNISRARKAYEEESNEENREELRDALNAKIIYLNVMEDYYWQKAGINGIYKDSDTTRMQATSDLIGIFEDKVNLFKEQTQFAIDNRNGATLLGFAKPLLLGNDGPNKEEVDRQALVNSVIKSFEMRSEDLKKLVEQKKETLDELVKVSRVLHAHVGTNQIYDILLVHGSDDDDFKWQNDNFELLGIGIRMDTSDTSNIQVTSFFPENSLLTKLDIENYENHLYLLEPNKEINAPLLEAVNFMQRLSDSLEENSKT